MSDVEDFFDTGVLLYLLSGDTDKADRVEQLLAGRGTISVQVPNEFAAVALRKLRMPLGDVREVLATVRAVCSVEAVQFFDDDDLVEAGARKTRVNSARFSSLRLPLPSSRYSGKDAGNCETPNGDADRYTGVLAVQYSAFSPFAGTEVGTSGVPAWVMSNTAGSSPASPRCTSSTDSPTACP